MDRCITSCFVDWAGFGVWCGRVFGGRYGRDVLCYARRFCRVLCFGDGSVLLGVGDGVRRHALKGLSALAKFLGVEWVERFRRVREAYGLKWSSPGGVHPLISSIDFNGMVGYVKRLLEAVPESLDVVCYSLLTGLRVSEVFASMRLVRERFGEYFNSKLGVLEHFRFPDIFLRKTKSAYVSVYLPVLSDFASRSRFKTYDSLRCVLHRRGLDLNLNYCRKIFATYLRKHGVDPEIIDLLQGRVARSMFVRHYYRPDINVEFGRVREVLSGMLVELGFENMLKAS